MRSQQLPAIGLLCILSCILGACASPDSRSASPEASVHATDTLIGDRTTEPSTKAPVAKSAQTCNLSTAPLDPLAAPENMPVFEQFNFRPTGIVTDAHTVTFKTPYYDFTLCRGDRTWTITSATGDQENAEAAFDYQQMLANIANPSYSEIDINGETYRYRIRLQADWLDDQLAAGELPFTPAADAATSESAKEAVYFELQRPSGELINKALYTLTDLRAAQLGASLGDPRIAGAVVVDDQLWFAATASQGEGNSGFASLIRYDLASEALTVEQPAELQGNQITAIAATKKDTLTLWLGTKVGGEGNPYLPADGLVAYQPNTQNLTAYSVTNSPLVGAIPFQIEAEEEVLWVATGEGVCQVDWQLFDSGKSWDCWRFTATAELPAAGVDLYPSALATAPTDTLNQNSIEVLWASTDASATWRYEVAYDPGFEVQLPSGGYWHTDQYAEEVTQLAPGEEALFWPGHAWHWAGDRFTRSFDEVALNMVGGGPYGLSGSDIYDGFYSDNNAIRGDFDLLDITPTATKVRHYSGWVDGTDLSVYPTVVPAESSTHQRPNPLLEMAVDLPESPGF